MPLHLPGSLILGPRTAAAPTTLLDFLTSIGKTSFYAQFLAGQGMIANSDGSGGAVVDGGAVGLWTAHVSNNYSASFIQATSASRPAYGASRNGKPGIYGNAASWHLALNSTTANNQPYTLLVSNWMDISTSGQQNLVTQGTNSVAWRTQETSFPETFYFDSAVASPATPQCWRRAPSVGGGTASYGLKMGIAIDCPSSYGAAMNLFRYPTGVRYASSTFHELWIVPLLTANEIAKALDYLV